MKFKSIIIISAIDSIVEHRPAQEISTVFGLVLLLSGRGLRCPSLTASIQSFCHYILYLIEYSFLPVNRSVKYVSKFDITLLNEFKIVNPFDRETFSYRIYEVSLI